MLSAILYLYLNILHQQQKNLLFLIFITNIFFMEVEKNEELFHNIL